jgi:uncharacterized protein YqeY
MTSTQPPTTTFKDRLEADLRASMKARDELVTSTLRMAIAAVRTEEVSGKAARTLTDDEVLAVLKRETKKRREAATAFADAGRAEQAERERAEEGVLTAYLPVQLSDDELVAIVTAAVGSVDVTGKQALGQAMKAANAVVAGRAEGGRVAAEVRRQLGI